MSTLLRSDSLIENRDKPGVMRGSKIRQKRLRTLQNILRLTVVFLLIVLICYVSRATLKGTLLSSMLLKVEKEHIDKLLLKQERASNGVCPHTTHHIPPTTHQITLVRCFLAPCGQLKVILYILSTCA